MMAVLRTRTVEIQVHDCQCDVCGREWTTKGPELPRRCVNHACRSMQWNRPRGRPRKSR